jgi:predicted negative regulator of RcsB-dependent stress response
MQTQDGPAEFFFKLWPKLEQNKNLLIGGGVAILVAAFAGYFISSQRAQKEIDAGEALTAALINPAATASSTQTAGSLEVIADKYSGTAAAGRAQVQAAAAMFDSGNYTGAQAGFEKYLNSNAVGPLAAVAALGIAKCLEAQDKLDQAIAAYQRVTSSYGGSSCAGPAEYALGRICEQQNKLPDAMAHYEKVMNSTLSGSLSNEARARAAELQSKIAASTPKAVLAPPSALTNHSVFKP